MTSQTPLGLVARTVGAQLLRLDQMSTLPPPNSLPSPPCSMPSQRQCALPSIIVAACWWLRRARCAWSTRFPAGIGLI